MFPQCSNILLFENVYPPKNLAGLSPRAFSACYQWCNGALSFLSVAATSQDEDRRRRRSTRDNRCINVVFVVGAGRRRACSIALNLCMRRFLSMLTPMLPLRWHRFGSNLCSKREEREQRRAVILGRQEGASEVAAAKPRVQRSSSLQLPENTSTGSPTGSNDGSEGGGFADNTSRRREFGAVKEEKAAGVTRGEMVGEDGAGKVSRTVSKISRTVSTPEASREEREKASAEKRLLRREEKEERKRASGKKPPPRLTRLRYGCLVRNTSDSNALWQCKALSPLCIHAPILSAKINACL